MLNPNTEQPINQRNNNILRKEIRTNIKDKTTDETDHNIDKVERKSITNRIYRKNRKMKMKQIQKYKFHLMNICRMSTHIETLDYTVRENQQHKSDKCKLH